MANMFHKDTRYQNQTWLVRRWRDRWLLAVPWIAFRGWRQWWTTGGVRAGRVRFADAWSIARGHADGKRQWWFTAEEAGMRLEEVPRTLTVGDLLRDSEARLYQPQSTTSCTTGHYAIDRATGGFERGSVWAFGAETNWGKSSFLVMVADENIRKGRKVLIVSSEDDQKLYGNRLLIRRSRVCAERFKAKALQTDERDRIRDVVKAGEDQPVFFDARGRSVEWVASRTKDLVREYGIDLVAFDYLQAFDSDKRHQDRRNQVSYIARALTDVAKLANISGIIFSQITIAEGRSFPDKNSIKESKDVGNAAEVVMMGFTPAKPITRRDGSPLISAGERALNLDKNKDGPKGMFPVKWDDHSACFDVSLDPEAERYQAITGGEFDTFGDSAGSSYP